LLAMLLVLIPDRRWAEHEVTDRSAPDSAPDEDLALGRLIS
jgi:hypothetical protein